jgi:hypothetical protein
MKEDVVPELLQRISPRHHVALLVSLRSKEVRSVSPEHFYAFNGEDSAASSAKSVADALIYLQQAKVEIVKTIEKAENGAALCLCLSQIMEAEANLCVAAERILLVQDEMFRHRERVGREHGSTGDDNSGPTEGNRKH